MASILTGLFIGICLACAGFISILKYGFMHISNDAPTVANIKPDRLNLLNILLKKQDEVLSSLTLGYYFLNITIIIIMTHDIFNRFTPLSQAVYIGLLGIFLGLATSILPKLYIYRQNREVFLALLPALRIFYFIFLIPARLVNRIAFLVHIYFPKAFSSQKNLFNSSDYLNITKRYEDMIITDIDREKRKHLQKIFIAMGLMTIKQVVTPLDNMEMINESMAHEDLLPLVFASKNQRILVYQDQPDNIVGILHTRLLLRAFCLAEGDKEAVDITSAISEPVFVDEDKLLLEQMEEFLGKQQPFALVRDQTGKLTGTISLEKIFEAVSLPMHKFYKPR